MVEVVHRDNLIQQLDELQQQGIISAIQYESIHKAIEDETFEAIDPDNPPMRA